VDTVDTEDLAPTEEVCMDHYTEDMVVVYTEDTECTADTEWEEWAWAMDMVWDMAWDMAILTTVITTTEDMDMEWVWATEDRDA